MGPIGSIGMANPKDFQVPVASFDIDESSTWEGEHLVTVFEQVHRLPLEQWYTSLQEDFSTTSKIILHLMWWHGRGSK